MTEPATTRGATNRVVVRLLASRMHRLLSRWLCIIDYTGRQTGQRYGTPTQYVQPDPQTVLILVGRHATKTWWRNFTEPGHPITVTIANQHHHGTATAHLGRDEPRVAQQHLDTYLAKYPRAKKLLPADEAQRVAQTCIVVTDLHPHA